MAKINKKTIGIKRINIKYAYYSCEICGRQIDSSEYYTWGRCYLCR